jgi:hypothetical protein
VRTLKTEGSSGAALPAETATTAVLLTSAPSPWEFSSWGTTIQIVKSIKTPAATNCCFFTYFSACRLELLI